MNGRRTAYCLTFSVHEHFILADGLRSSLLGTAGKRESRFCGYNLKRFRPSVTASRFEKVSPRRYFSRPVRAGKRTIVGVRIFTWAVLNPYNNFVMFYRLDLILTIY